MSLRIIQARFRLFTTSKYILKLLFIIQTWSTWFNVSLIIYPLHSVLQQFSHITSSYLLLERKLILTYWIMNLLQSLISLIQSKIHQPVINSQHNLKEVCGSLLSMYKSLSQLKLHLMNSISNKHHVENTSSRSVYSEGRANREHILRRFFQIWWSQTCGFTY